MPVCSQKNIWRNKVYGVEMPSSRLKRLHYALERSWLRKKCRRFTINNVWLLHCSRMEIIHAPIGLYPNYATVSTVGTVCEFITSERTRRRLWSYLDTYDVDVSLATLRHECSSAVVYRCTTVSCVADLHTHHIVLPVSFSNPSPQQQSCHEWRHSIALSSKLICFATKATQVGVHYAKLLSVCLSVPST